MLGTNEVFELEEIAHALFDLALPQFDFRGACCCSRVAVHALTVIARERSDRGNP
jgi:hypothetical protein